MIQRMLYSYLKQYLFQGKALIITGPRQTGKTTLLKMIMADYPEALYLNCDEPDTRQNLQNVTSIHLKAYLGESRLVLIDEGQRIENIGITIKLLVDNIPDMQVIVTGSSAIELADKIQETLAGRKFTFHLPPLSWKEMVDYHGLQTEKRLLNQRLIYGMYPDAVLKTHLQKEILTDIVQSYLYKDLLQYNEIRKPDLLSKLLIALALQIGQEVSFLELANLLKVSSITVEKYIDLLEKVFVIFRLSSYAKNHRNELKKSKKIYFYDTGIRNAILGAFQPIGLRTDAGALWENYVISERQKTNQLSNPYLKSYFWRTVSQQEIDLIEITADEMNAYEIKWKASGKQRPPAGFRTGYPQAGFEIITPDTFYNNC
jgi:predicted AAA+ superfamily ATPase